MTIGLIHPGTKALVTLICMALAISADADTVDPPTANPASETASVPTAADTSVAIATDPLLPDILSPGERMVWGEHGIMRAIGAYPLTEESRENELSLRRSLLTAHQIGGFVTLAAMLATVYAGQMVVNGDDGYIKAKKRLAWATVGTYFTTATLALITPPPLVRRKEWSSVSTHKALAWVHFTGMVITPILGILIEEDRDKQALHQVSGYVTTAAFAGAMIVITF